MGGAMKILPKWPPVLAQPSDEPVPIDDDSAPTPGAAVDNRFSPVISSSVPSAGSRYGRARRYCTRSRGPAATVVQIVLGGILGILLGLLVLRASLATIISFSSD